MTAYRFRENTRPPADLSPSRRGGHSSSKAESAAGGPPGPDRARPPLVRQRLVRQRPRPLRRALSGAALLALSGALALPATARAQDVVLVSNMAALSTGSALVTSPTYRKEIAGFVVGEGETRRAQQFSTGADAAGYTLGSVELNLRQAGGAGSVPLVAIHLDSSGEPGTLLGVLDNPADPFGVTSLEAGNRTFTAASALSLAANTNYWLVLKDTKSTAGEEHYTASTANSEDETGAEGFGIANGHVVWTEADDWGTANTGIVRMEIRGTVKEERTSTQTVATLVSNIEQTKLVNTTRQSISQRFTTSSDMSGQTLTSIDFVTENSESFSAKVCEVGSDDLPTTACTDLTAPGTFAAGTVSFTVPSAIALDPGTTYAVVVTHPTGIGGWGITRFGNIASQEGGAGAVGWDIFHQFHAQRPGGSLVPHIGFVLLMTLEGTPGVPDAPTGFTAGAGDAQVALSWNAVTDEETSGLTGYEYRFKTGTEAYPATWMSIPLSRPGQVNEAGYTVTGLANGTAHTFELRAVSEYTAASDSPEDDFEDHSLEGEAVEAGPVTPVPPRPDAPTGFTADTGNERVLLSWDVPASASGVSRHEYRHDNDLTWVQIPNSGVGGANEAGYTVLGLTNETAYTFELRAVNISGYGDAATAGPVTPSPDPVWSATMTVGATFYGHGYEENEGGSLSDYDFEYRSTTYTVELVDLDDTYAVAFRVDEDGLPEDGTLTLEIDGHEFPFEDTTGGGGDYWEWAVPEGLSNSDLPIGDQVVVCLLAGGQVCPTSVPSALSVADASAEEGEPLTFTVALSPPSTETVTVDWATSGGTAVSGTDFTAGTGTLTFTAGDTEKTFTVATTEDVTDQVNETFTVTLSNATGAAISGATATGTIKDDDAPPLVAWSTVMTVAEVFGDSYGYSENNGGELADADFQYDSATYTVEEIFVSRFDGVRFQVDKEGLPEDEILTLVIDGHELPFSESELHEYGEWEWYDPPEGLNDPVNDLPVGEGVVVCLRNSTGVCPARALTVTDVSAEEGEDLTFTATLWQERAQTVTVDWATSEGTATSGTDFTPGTGTLTFTAGVTEQMVTVTVATIEDVTDEDHETFTVTLSNPTSGTITGAPATGIIVDDDGTSPVWSATMTVGTPQIGGHGYEEEGRGGSLSDDDFAYGLTAATYTTYVVEAVTVDPSALTGVSFSVDRGVPRDAPLTLVIDGHEFPFKDRNRFSLSTLLFWAVPEDLNDPVNDLPIGSEVEVCLRTAGQVCPASVPTVTVSVADVSAEEGENLTFTATLSAASTETVTVDWATSGGTATSGVDFTADLGTLTFTAGVTEQTFTVSTTEDMTEEEDETFTVTLSNATNATIAGATATGTIKNDDATLSIADAGGSEGSPVTFTATLSATVAAEVMATWTMSIESGNTAVAADLGTTRTGPVMVTANQRTGTFEVPTATDDLAEGNETFTVTLSNASNAQLAADPTATGTIEDDDQPTVGFEKASAIVLEELGTISFKVELDKASTVPITVDWETRAGTAEADMDYTEASGTLTFAAGDTEKTINVTFIDDAIHEGVEEFTVHLIGTDDAVVTLGTLSSAIARIADRDRVAITMEGTTVAEDVGTVTLTLTASAPSTAEYTIDYATENGTAEAGADYTAASGEVTFAAGVTEQTIAITVLDDAVDEDQEDFKVRLSNATDRRIDLPADPARVLIEDDEVTDANAAPSFSSDAAISMAENGTEAGTVLATDSDTGDDVTGYAITGGADQTFFSIGATDGALTFDAAPNYEDAKDQGSNNTYVVVVQATSGAGERVKTATQTITVTVTDVSGEAPGKPAAPTVSAASVTSLSVNWSAPDNAGPAIDDYDVQYREGASGDWSDGGHSGTAVTATLTGLSENTSYQVQVRAKNDEGAGAWSDSGSGATDANAAPSFTSPATFSMAENGTEVAMVMASDSDSEDKIERYDITGGADQTFFLVIASSGHLEFRDAPNYEDAKDQGSNNTYVVEVTATSGAGEREKTATQTVTVSVTDVSGEAPGKPAAPTVSAASVTSLSVNWSAPDNAGPAIDDYDVQYREGASGDWSDGGHSGTAVTATLTGLSENTSYQVQVRAKNDEGAGAWSDSGSGATDANAAPSFDSSATFSAAENQTTAGTVRATDSDSDDDVTGYALTGGADQTFFSIGATDGALTFDAAPNYEDAKDQGSNNTYVVEVTATSGAGERVKTATQTITVTVTDVSGEAPGKPAAPTVSAASVTSLSVNWSAPDNAGPAIDDYDVQYREGASGDWSDGNHAGTALTATLTGLSENTSYQVQVRATNDEGTGSWSDAGSGATDTNAAAAFTSPATFSMAENGTEVAMVMASDSDSEDKIERYDITGGADQAFFSIGATDGALTFDAAPNYEDAKDQGGNNTYVVEVTATSGAGEREKTATQTVTVSVTDVSGEAPGKPDAPTVSAASVTSLSVNWSAPDNAGPAITDYDVQYREGASGDWSDGNHSGTAVTATLTGLSENTSYQVQVRAKNDEGTGAWSDSGSGATDANAAPAFTSPATFSMAENGTEVAMVLASDSDSDDDVTGYALTGGADQAFFSIGATDGALTFDAAPNYEDAKDQGSNNTYVVEVTATSGAGERVKTATQTITVTVTDVAGEAPGKPAAPGVSAASVTSLSVNWSAPTNAGPAITDYDVQYREGNSGGWTDGNYNGAATTATLTGLSENTSYQVQVRATNDEGTGSWSDSGSRRTDANAAPSFSSSATFDAAENRTSAGTVRATDSDTDDDVTGYALTGGADRSFFSIGATSGALTFDAAPNYEDAQDIVSVDPANAAGNNQYVVVVRATSGTGAREMATEQTVVVTVTDDDTEAPGKPAAPAVTAASATSLTVNWSAPDNAGPAITDYDYRYRTTSPQENWTEVTNTTITGLSATIGSLSETTSYDVQVRATNDEGTGDWSLSGAGATRDKQVMAPGQVTGVSVTNQVEQLMVSWNEVAGASGYKVQWKSGGQDYNEGARQYIVSSGATTEHTISNLTAGVEYTVRVIATKNNAADGPPSAEETGTPLASPPPPSTTAQAPENLQAATGNSQVTLSWDAPNDDGGADVTGYAYRYKESGGDFIDYTDIPDSGPGEANARSYTVTGLTNGLEYVFHVRAVNEHGGGARAAVTVTLPTGVNTESEELPAEVTLSANYPNPFNPETTIRYGLPKAGQVRLAVYDMLGHEVAVLVDRSKPAGNHTVRFGAGDLPSGVYAYRLHAGGETVARTMMLLK